MAELPLGLRGTAVTTVRPENTALALGSGDLPVFGTPALVALMEAAAVEALGGRLGADETTVGTAIAVTHLAATPLGLEVRAEAELVAAEGRKLTFALTAQDGREPIGEGRHERMVVGRARFLARVETKR